MAQIVSATLNYVRPGATRPRRYLYPRPDGAVWTGTDDPRAVAIMDGRDQAADYTLDGSGFMLEHAPSAVTDFSDDAGVERIYYPECAEIVRRATGAARVHVFDHTLRGPNQPRDPVMRVHNDYTDRSATQRIRDLLPDEAEALLLRRYAYINVWRPIAHPVYDIPLAFCDARSFSEDDLVLTDLVYEDRVGEIASVRFQPNHRWIFFSRMTPEEVALIKCYDSARDGRARGSFHSAFVDGTAPGGAPARQSIEIRTIAFFPDQA